jgi:hypothetical protein
VSSMSCDPLMKRLLHRRWRRGRRHRGCAKPALQRRSARQCCREQSSALFVSRYAQVPIQTPPRFMNATEENDSCSSAYSRQANKPRLGLLQPGSLQQPYLANLLQTRWRYRPRSRWRRHRRPLFGDLATEFTAVERRGGSRSEKERLLRRCWSPARDYVPYAPNDQNPKGSTRTFSGNFRGNICTSPILQSACQMNFPPIFRAVLLANSGTNNVKISTSTKILVYGLPAHAPLCGSIAITTG